MLSGGKSAILYFSICFLPKSTRSFGRFAGFPAKRYMITGGSIWHIVMLQILETKKVQDTDIATKVSVELQLTDPNARAKDRIVKKSEKDGFFTALDLGSVWLARALAAKK